MRMNQVALRGFAGATAATAVLGLGALGASPAFATDAPPKNDHPKVVDHRNDRPDHVDRGDRGDRNRHHDLLAICRHDHHGRYFLIRVHDRRELRQIERRFDLDCRVLRVA